MNLMRTDFIDPLKTPKHQLIQRHWELKNDKKKHSRHTDCILCFSEIQRALTCFVAPKWKFNIQQYSRYYDQKQQALFIMLQFNTVSGFNCLSGQLDIQTIVNTANFCSQCSHTKCLLSQPALFSCLCQDEICSSSLAPLHSGSQWWSRLSEL